MRCTNFTTLSLVYQIILFTRYLNIIRLSGLKKYNFKVGLVTISGIYLLQIAVFGNANDKIMALEQFFQPVLIRQVHGE